MNSTTAVILDNVSKRPLCPGCVGGRLHPYEVRFDPQRFGPVVVELSGWVAVCVGDDDGSVEPCGFSMQLERRS